MNYPKLLSCMPQKDFSLVLKYDNGEMRVYNFSENFSHPFYAPLKNYELFKNVTVSNGGLEWATGQDFCPFTLYEKSTPQKTEQFAQPRKF